MDWVLMLISPFPAVIFCYLFSFFSTENFKENKRRIVKKSRLY